MTSLYARFVLPGLLQAGCGAPAVRARREEVAPRAHGRVLEVGAGLGLNFRFYDPARVRELVALDPSPELGRRALKAWSKAAPGLPGVGFRFEAGVAERLPFGDAEFDSVVLTFTLCSVRDPARALAEIRRVLKRGGAVHFAEHGLAPDPRTVRWQKRLEPAWSRLAGGCRLTRAPAASFEAAGFQVALSSAGWLEGAPRFAGWCETGEARSP